MLSARRPDPQNASAANRTPDAAAPSGLRALTEWLVLLALAVTLFRCFGVESFMISTGSMAPCLLGYHTRISCPACGLTFAHGAQPPDEISSRFRSPSTLYAQATGIIDDRPDAVACPNCSRVCTAGAGTTATEGDQLLVHKDAYRWRRLVGYGGPRRWETVVFRKPDDAHPAYVKRIVGLPNESIELRDGDVYANGQLQRKPLAAQLSTRILIASSDFPVYDDDPNWESRWVSNGARSAWTIDGSTFEYVPRNAGSVPGPAEVVPQSAWDWITYRHWIRSGGATSTTVALTSWPDDLQLPDPLLSPLEYDPARQQLKCLGALSHAQWERWETATDDSDFRNAIQDLYRESHVVPLNDASPYNPPGSAAANQVHDLQLELSLEWRRGDGEFAIEMTDGVREFRCELDFGRQELRILADGHQTLYAGPVLLRRGAPAVLIMSTFDQQLLLAKDGELLCDPLPYERAQKTPVPLRRPVRFGARDAAVAVASASLYRDIYYTPTDGRSSQTFSLSTDEYFVLGDNSSVSIDSRHWQQPGISDSALIGKPLFVHLPSRPLRLEWGGKVRQIRVPDFERMRYIR